MLRNELVGSKAWSIIDSGSSGSFCGPTVYYSKSIGNLNNLTTWGDNPDGTGNNPPNFTTADQIFAVRNRSTAGLSNNWIVSGNSLTYTGFTGSFSSFAIGDNIVVLPVTWLSVHCRRVDARSIELKWATTEEINSSIFEVLRRTKSEGFNVIGQLKAAGNSQFIKHYVFMDESAPGFVTDYQIRLISEGGSNSMSDISSATAFSGSEAMKVSVYPNPAESLINVTIPDQDMPCEYVLYSHSGQRIKQGFVSAQNAVISISSVNSGLYMLQIKTESGLHCENVWVK